jgi:hypothetical protein
LLRAFSDIRREVIGGYGDYTYFINELENLFQGEYHSALEEFGLPAQVTDKLMPRLDGPESLDDVLVRLKALDPNSSGLSGFELQLFNEFRETL